MNSTSQAGRERVAISDFALVRFTIGYSPPSDPDQEGFSVHEPRNCHALSR
jgi:hypothetical protein